ncbi:MAG: hypothetical protein Q7T73_11225 [Beijerinckiaceae bacterium]|nr:hypothetical protein [Beijerinckiaceae bacterium]
MATDAFPDVVDPDAVGTYDAVAGAGGGFVWDEVLEYRVWCHPKDGNDDFFFAFPTYAEASAFAVLKRESDASLAQVEDPLALVRQEEYIDESSPGEYVHVTERRVTEWPPDFLSRPRRTARTIPDFLSPDAPANRLEILRGVVTNGS